MAEKHIAEIEDLKNHLLEGEINQVPTKYFQAKPEIQKIENFLAKKLQTKRNKRDTGLNLVPLEEPSEIPRVNPTGYTRVNPEGYPGVNPEGYPRVNPEGSPEFKR